MTRVIRRSRYADSDQEEEWEEDGRQQTLISTAPGDRKRLRHSTSHVALPPSSDVRRTRNNVSTIRQHAPGSIKRITLTNFVTYTHATFNPGPTLNMVIGPNGTGKSTLVCAICLGLGWGPALLGRAKDPIEFIKHGSREAEIEIELQRATTGHTSTRVNPVIKRIIKKEKNDSTGGKSSWSINGSQATQKQVREVAEKFNIQVDNLCQFLPQDRVVEFAQMNSVQMLQTTLRAAAPPQVSERLTRLQNLRDEQLQLMGSNKGDRDMLESLERRHESQRTEVEQLKERIETLRNIDWLELCRPIPLYATAKRQTSEANQEKNRLEREVDVLQAEVEPVLRKVNAKQIYAKTARDNRDDKNKSVKRAFDECRRLELEVQAREIARKDAEDKINAEKEGVRKDKQELSKRKLELTNLRIMKENEPGSDFSALTEQINILTVQSREASTKVDAAKDDLRSWNAKGLAAKERRATFEAQKTALDTEIGQQEQRLQRMSSDTHQAWAFIRENQNEFRHPVFGPPLVTCKVKDQRHTKLVEAVLQDSDYKLITVQCREDFEKLQQVLNKDKRLHDIALRVCRTPLSDFQPPMSQEQLQALGLESWAIDLLDGPPEVLAMLCSEKSLHRTALATATISPDQHEAIAASSIRSYVTSNQSVQFIRRAEYGTAGVSARYRSVRPASHWTDQPIDNSGRKADLDRQMRECMVDMAEAKEHIAEITAAGKNAMKARDEADEELDRIKKEKEAKQKALAVWRGIDIKIAGCEEKIQISQDNISSVRRRVEGHHKDADEALIAKSQFVLDYCVATSNLKDAEETLLLAEIQLVQADNDFANLRAANEHIRQALETKRAAHREAEQNLVTRKARAVELRDEIMALKEKAQALVDGENNHGLEEMINRHGRNAEISERVLDNLIDIERAKLEINSGGTVDADQVLKEFEARATRIEKLGQKLEGYNRTMSESMKDIRRLRTELETGLTPIITKIDSAFGESFARIGLSGSVSVHKASSTDPQDMTEENGGQENGLDFANWAIHIHVSFRHGEPLQLLDSHRQSGGERAVSTIFYLMALQSLSRSPFRVVDEINQGMDPRNERMVHGRMVDIASRLPEGEEEAGGSQYFLITPKLLSGLRYERGMTVLCIVSGENMPSAEDRSVRDGDENASIVPGQKMDLPAFARRAKELGLGDSRRLVDATA